MYLMNFREQVWMTLSDTEKKETLAKLEQAQAKKQGREPRKIEYRKLKRDYLGFFDDIKGQLIINTSNLSDAGKSLASVVHEGRHAYQFQVVNNKKPHKNLPEWTLNWFGYLNPRKRGIEEFDYRLQSIESDAWAYTCREIKNIAKTIKDKRLSTYALKLMKNNELQSLLAKQLYGKKYMQIIDNKISAAYSKTKDNSYSTVAEQLGQEESEDARSIAAIEGDSFADAKKPDEKTILAAKQEKDVKTLAAKYGIPEEAALLAFKNLQETKHAKAVEPKAPKKEESVTVKVSVKKEKEGK